MANILITLAEEADKTTDNHFAVKYRVDENDCYDFSNGLKELGHDVFFVNWCDLAEGEFIRMFHDNQKQFIKPLALAQMDLIWAYKMEGFYFDRPRFLSMVETFRNSQALVVNHPDTIRHNLNKHYLIELAQRGVRVIPTCHIDTGTRERLRRGEKLVLKPLYGERGNSILLAGQEADLDQLKGHEDDYIAQDFLPCVRAGEKSLVFFGKQYQLAVLKRPSPENPDEFRCNESLGGTVEVYEPRKEEIAYCVDVLDAYESLGYPVQYSRIDFLTDDDGPILMEAELINPAAYANYSQKGAWLGQRLAHYFSTTLALRSKTCGRTLGSPRHKVLT